MAEYRLTPAAQRDLEAIFDHSAAQWGLAQAMRYTEQIAAASAALAAAPLQAPGCDHIRPGYRRRSAGQHVLYVRPTAYGVAVIRILHRRMDAARHLLWGPSEPHHRVPPPLPSFPVPAVIPADAGPHGHGAAHGGSTSPAPKAARKAPR